MFQTFDDPGGPALGRKHLPLLRKALKAAGLDGFIVPHEDEWQNEYVPPAYDRLAWTTGFTGSAGAAVVLTEAAAVFTDGLRASSWQRRDPSTTRSRASLASVAGRSPSRQRGSIRPTTGSAVLTKAANKVRSVTTTVLGTDVDVGESERSRGSTW